MKKMGNHNSISRKLSMSFALLLCVSLTTLSQNAPAPAATPTAAVAAPSTGGGDPVAGKALFNANCAACHNLDRKMTGPALRGVSAKYDKEWLYKWIKNSSALIKSGDAKAIAIY